jgi:8-oxo-dGTP pyrophosphatase MutT (NUDIX family)
MTGFSIYNQSGIIPFRMNNKELQVLMITSSSGRRWVFPKGIIEDGLTPEESAAQEALEEAGVEGDVIPRELGVYKRKKWGGTVCVKMYAMRVSRVFDSWDEDTFRKRAWLSVEEAEERISDPALGEILLVFASLKIQP